MSNGYVVCMCEHIHACRLGVGTSCPSVCLPSPLSLQWEGLFFFQRILESGKNPELKQSSSLSVPPKSSQGARAIRHFAERQVDMGARSELQLISPDLRASIIRPW